MDKYRLFDKIVKCKACTFYKAEATSNRQGVLVKKLHKQMNWQELLKSKQLSVIKNGKTKYLPEVKQVVKEEQRFYIVLQPLEQNLQCIIKSDVQKQDIMKISKQLICMLGQFKRMNISPVQLRPAYFFLSNQRQILKLVHLQMSTQKDIPKLDLVELQDLKYLSPQQVLTSQPIDQRAAIFNIGLIIFELVTGKPLINANTKMNYMYQICNIFPGQNINIEDSNIRQNLRSHDSVIHNDKRHLSNNQNSRITNQSNLTNGNTQTFDKIMAQQNLSPQFTALLKQMLKVDRSQRITLDAINQAFDLIAENQINYQKSQVSPQLNFSDKNLFNMSEQDLQGIKFGFETKPTLSLIPCISNQSHTLAAQKNTEDDAVQPIIIKQSSKPQQNNSTGVSLGVGMSIQPTKQSTKHSRMNKNNPSFTTIKRPQLTNYAMNQANLGVQVGINPSLFSDNDF